MPRILTYNVHRCVGIDGKLDVPRVAAVIAAQAPDIVALQEVDVGRARTGWVDQAEQLARRLNMAVHFHAAFTLESELYGDAILTALPERLIKAAKLPGDPAWPGLEPRGALWVAVNVGGVDVQVITTHLGLVPGEQRRQARALLGSDWMGASECRDPMMLVGDFNATRLSAAYRSLAGRLTEARRAMPSRPAAPTFPSRLPLLAIDHVFVGRGVRVDAAWTPLDADSRKASDHLPFVVDFQLEG